MEQFKLDKLMDLRGKNGIVFGGAGYLGSVASETFHTLGCNITIASRNKPNGLKFIEKVRLKQLSSAKLQFESIDVCNNSNVDQFIKRLTVQKKRFDLLVFCIWEGEKSTWNTITESHWDKEINILISSHFRLVKKLEIFLNPGAKIIFVSSMYGLVAPDPDLYAGFDHANPASYGVAKAGLVQFSRYLSAWLADKKVNVNCISPGPFPFPEVAQNNPAFIKRLSQRTVLKRVGQPSELAGAFLLLGTDLGSFITGQNIVVDGGWTVC